MRRWGRRYWFRFLRFATAAPERAFLAVAGVLIGSVSLVSQRPPSAINSLLPRWVVAEWAVTFAAGGAFIIVGALIRSRKFERVGLWLSAIGQVIYASSILAVFGWVLGWPAALLWYLLASAYLARLYTSWIGHHVILRALGGDDEHPESP